MTVPWGLFTLRCVLMGYRHELNGKIIALLFGSKRQLIVPMCGESAKGMTLNAG